ncbi:hypothetical protein Tco_0775741 [Tanacetum coccineum]
MTPIFLMKFIPWLQGGDNSIHSIPEDMGLLDFIKTADTRKVQAVEVQKKDDQVFAPEVSAPAEVEPENVVPEDTYLDLTGPDEVVATQSGKSKRKRLGKQSDTLPANPLVSRPSFQADIQAHVVQSARITDVPVYTDAATVTSALENVGITHTSDVAGSSQLETSEGSDDSFYELSALNSAEAKRCMDYEQLYTEFNVGAARQICLESEVRSRAEHELELKEKLKGKYDARGRLLEEKDLEILRLKSLLVEEAEKAERAETAEVVRLRGQVSALTGEFVHSALDDSKAACAEAGSLITSLTSERDRLTSEVSTLHTAFQDFKEKAEKSAGRWFTDALGFSLCANCFNHPEYQGILGHALGRAVDFGMQEGLEAGHEHGVAGTPLSAVEAYNPEAARTSYFDAVRALEDVDFPLLSVPIYHSDDKAIVGETSLSFALLNVHSRAEGAKKHVAALRQLMMEIVSNPLSSQTWVGDTSTFAAPLSVEDFDEVDTTSTRSIVCNSKFGSLPLF